MAEPNAVRVPRPEIPAHAPAPPPKARVARVALHVLERSQWVPAPVDKAFAFFSDPACVPALLPRGMQIQIVTPLRPLARADRDT